MGEEPEIKTGIYLFAEPNIGYFTHWEKEGGPITFEEIYNFANCRYETEKDQGYMQSVEEFVIEDKATGETFSWDPRKV